MMSGELGRDRRPRLVVGVERVKEHDRRALTGGLDLERAAVVIAAAWRCQAPSPSRTTTALPQCWSGFPAVGAGELRELIAAAWRCQAPRALVADFEGRRKTPRRARGVESQS